MPEVPRFDLELPTRLSLPLRLDRVLEGESSLYDPETDTRSTFSRECDVRFFDDGTLTFETTYRGVSDQDQVASVVINYVRQKDGTLTEAPANSNTPFSNRIAYNEDPSIGIVGQVLDLRGL